jgi:undecaprenyl-diphosphatase
MPLLQVIVLAVVQGVTEFLPVSSTAHLYLTSWLLGWQIEDLSFDIALHIGTFAAVLIYFFRDWVQILCQGFGVGWGADPELKQNRRLLWFLALGSIPLGVFGLLFSHQAEGPWRNPIVMGMMLIFVGAMMYGADRAGRRNRNLSTAGFGDTLAIGAAQALAIVPGTSRSGITITAGLFRGLDYAAAARFSFLLSTPAVGAAAAKALYELHKAGGFGPGVDLTRFVVGVTVSAITGCLVIGGLLRYLRNHGLMFFVYYRVVFGIIVLALAFIRRPA